MGVSTALVSYVLNGKEKEARVGKDIAIKIRKVATKLKYQPNLIAKSLKSGKTNTIGLIVADISNPFFSNIARIIENEAKRHGYTVIFGSSDESAEKSQDLIDTLLNRQVDGLIIAPADNTQNQVKLLLKNKMPFVLIDRYFPGINTNTVSSNNYLASYTAVSHLLQNGYERIGMLVYQTNLFHMHERKRGYLQALKEHKIQGKKNWLMEATYQNITDDVERLLKALLLPEPKIDALFFSTNLLAVQGLKQIQKLGICVPEDLAVISFDESDAFDFFYSPITYVKQSVPSIGREAVNILLNEIKQGPKKHVQVEVEVDLIIRESSGVLFAGKAAS